MGKATKAYDNLVPKSYIKDGRTKKLKNNAVRMPRFDSKWELIRIDDTHTKVLNYTISDADSAIIPDWLINTFTRKVPIDLLRRFRDQAAKDYSASETKALCEVKAS